MEEKKHRGCAQTTPWPPQQTYHFENVTCGDPMKVEDMEREFHQEVHSVAS